MSKLLYGTQATPIVKHELMELIIPAANTATQINLLDLANLRDVKLLSLSFTTSEFFGALSPTGNAVFTQAALNGVTLTLQLYNGKQFLNDCPLINFFPFLVNTAAINSNPYYRDFCAQRVNWPKSFLNKPTPLAPAVATSILMSIWYSDIEEIEKKDSDFSFGNMK